jgi:hypothetical protein
MNQHRETQNELNEKDREISKLEKHRPSEKMIMQLVKATRDIQKHKDKEAEAATTTAENLKSNSSNRASVANTTIAAAAISKPLTNIPTNTVPLINVNVNANKSIPLTLNKPILNKVPISLNSTTSSSSSSTSTGLLQKPLPLSNSSSILQRNVATTAVDKENLKQ